MEDLVLQVPQSTRVVAYAQGRFGHRPGDEGKQALTENGQGHDARVNRFIQAAGLLFPLQMDFDSLGNLYVGSGWLGGKAVDVYRVLPDGTVESIPGVDDPDALAVILNGAARVVTVSEAEIRAAMRLYFTETHNVAEGAGAAPLAAVLKERNRVSGKKVAVVLSGGNVDRALYREVLAEG